MTWASLPDATSQTRSVPFAVAAASHRPSGLNATYAASPPRDWILRTISPRARS